MITTIPTVYLGNSGLKVTRLSFGNWITGHKDEAVEAQAKCIRKALDLGINYFDTAEV